MTLEEIKDLIPQYNDWKINICFWYGEEYTEKYCTWKRFLEHIKILSEVMGVKDESNRDMDVS